VRRVFWSEDALAEFCALLRYIAADDPAAAAKVAERIKAAVDGLAQMPTGRQGRVAGTYEKVVAGLPYIVSYALDETPAGESRLTILRIIHGARNWPEGAWPED
jgi:plasmid stabilization system protein ParE